MSVPWARAELEMRTTSSNDVGKVHGRQLSPLLFLCRLILFNIQNIYYGFHFIKMYIFKGAGGC